MSKLLMTNEKKETKGFEKQLIPEGIIDTMCLSIIDLWTQLTERQWVSKAQKKVLITFETQEMWEFDGKKKPLIISKKYTMSFFEKARLYADIKSWLGKAPEEGFDLMTLVGKPAKLQIMNAEGTNGKTYQNINTVLPSENKFKLINQEVRFSIGDYERDDYEKLYDRQKKVVHESPERKSISDTVDRWTNDWEKLETPKETTEDSNSDLPF